MAQETLPWQDPPETPGPVVIFDIDGVLASMAPFEHLIAAERSKDKDWKAFHRNFSVARPIRVGIRLTERIYDDLGKEVVYSTTRPEQHARRTLRWFDKQDLPHSMTMFRLFIRDGPRPALEVKLRHWWTFASKHGHRNPPLAWIDDEQEAVDELRRSGCPAWTVTELRNAEKAAANALDTPPTALQRNELLRDILEAGPEPAHVLRQRRAEQFPIWKAQEDQWKKYRWDWWENEKLRRRRRHR